MAKITPQEKKHLNRINGSRKRKTNRHRKPVKKRKSGKGKLFLGVIGLVLIGVLIYL